MSLIPCLVAMPLLAGLACLLLHRCAAICRVIAVAALAAACAASWLLFSRGSVSGEWHGVAFNADGLARLVCLGIGFFSLLVGLYSCAHKATRALGGAYFGFLLLAEGSAIAAALAGNLLLLLCAWGFMGLPLYALIASSGSDTAASTAKKAMIIVGGSDVFLVLGVAILLTLPSGGGPIPLSHGAAVAAYCCLAVAAFAKAGAMPLHSWIPDCAEYAPVPVTALLPASLDKLLGIYLLARMHLTLFAVGDRVQLLCAIVGATTIVAAVMMAMVQHNLKRLLGYHAVSQVGYMVLGIATGTPVGIAGAIFHMLNNCIYKTCLVLGAGAVEERGGTAELDNLGGLASAMPMTFAAMLVSSLAISGIPPLNGFASKWMIYQGIIQMNASGGRLWVVWLVAAMFGSVLTLASFIKILNAVYLGPPSRAIAQRIAGVREVGALMWAPMAALAGLCVVFGVRAASLAVGRFVAPAVGAPIGYIGLWDSTLATWLILLGIACGLLLYLAGRRGRVRRTDPFLGGEAGDDRMSLSGVDFYLTIREMGVLGWVYARAEGRVFDLYDQGRRVALGVARLLSRMHDGALPVYLGWCLAGLLMLLYLLMR